MLTSPRRCGGQNAPAAAGVLRGAGGLVAGRRAASDLRCAAPVRLRGWCGAGLPRPIWSGAISFGLVNVPVKLFAAISPKDVRFHQLHGPDGARVQQRRICAADGDEVPYEEVVKGFEVAPDEYVPVTQEELDAIAPEVTRAIEIEE